MKITVVGSGKMGSDIFNLISASDAELVWLCLDEPEADKARSAFQKRLSRQQRSGLIEATAYDEKLARTEVTNDASHSRGSDLIIEAIWEDLNSKQKLFGVLYGVSKPDCVFATNTSSIPISAIFDEDKRSAFGCGMHFFYPINLKDLVEVNLTERFSDKARDTVRAFLRMIGRRHIELPESANFLMNRLLLGMQNEAVKLVNEGIADHKVIDAVLRQELFPIGVFEFFDHVGLDIMNASVENYASGPDAHTDLTPLLDHLGDRVKQGFLGVKTNKGYYDYPMAPGTFDLAVADPQTQALIRERCLGQFFHTVQQALDAQFLTESDLDRAIMEYWTLDESLLEKGRSLGFLA